jgi:pyruvate,water dikinase
MNHDDKQVEKLLNSLQERAKELNCMYRIEELMNRRNSTIDEVCMGIIEAIPPGFQYPDICIARINLLDEIYESPNFVRTEWEQSADIVVQEKTLGRISVYYTKEMPAVYYGPFLKEEAKLIRTIAERLGHFVIYYRMKNVYGGWEAARTDVSGKHKEEWEIVLDLLKQTDRNLFLDISHKMLNFLCWSGVAAAEKLRQSPNADHVSDDDLERDSNRPHKKVRFTMSGDVISKIFQIASTNLSAQEIFSRLQKWIQQDKLNFLIQVMNRNLPLSTIADAVRRYHHIETGGVELDASSRRGVQVSLIRRFLSNQLKFINIAKHYIKIADFYELLEKVIFSTESHGKLGGKSAGLVLAAEIIRKTPEYSDIIGSIKIPKTWNITSDMVLYFMHYNNFAEVVEQKYKDINQIRFEYPHIVNTFKNSHFPPEMVAGLSVALDDFEDCPLIVRSSSLLEDGVGTAFSGKYKSLFLANQGSKPERLEALMDAIAEVYASTFSPDPIEYRTEHGLIDFDEEMAIMIQEVVGNRVGRYFLPTFAGVAFSNNEFRWSARINRKDGLLRIVPGLGTRAVDRLSDDYPMLVAPGQPSLRVNASIDEVLRYSPKQVDVINLETNSFETVDVKDLLKEVGAQIPGINKIISIHKDDTIRQPMGLNIDFENDECVVTFEGLISNSPLINQVRTILNLLEEKLGRPVDIEFASDGRDFYLLQCRPQSYSEAGEAARIPRDVPSDRLIFSANRYISNGSVPDIQYIVYIDPQRYGELEERDKLLEVGRIVNKLNRILPKRQFILMGPGRWGSRGDIKLGVSVTYSDINNTAVLIEIARKKGNYVPDLSFGTHFFQDLVEANIRYLPLYPDDIGTAFNEGFLLKTKNSLAELLPDYSHQQDTVRVIDIAGNTGGLILKVLMNADLDEAVGMLAEPDL